MPTKIEWTDESWSPITGCSVHSPGCTNCYAMRLAGTRLKHHSSRVFLTRDTKAGPVWTGEVRFNAQWLKQPMFWRRSRMVFVCPHADLFHENVPDEWIDRIFAVMALAPQHIFQVLTKRPDRMREYMLHHLTGFRIRDRMQEIMPQQIIQMSWPLPNVWLGTSVEDQTRAEERIPHLLATPAALRWLSCEPLLGEVDLHAIPVGGGNVNALVGALPAFPPLGWVVCGGESGPRARPFDPLWGEALLAQCERAGVPFFFKQLGVKLHPKSYKAFDQWPALWQVRQWPDLQPA